MEYISEQKLEHLRKEVAKKNTVHIDSETMEALLDAVVDLDEWRRFFVAAIYSDSPVFQTEPLYPNPNWSQDVAMLAKMIRDLRVEADISEEEDDNTIEDS